jgi:hypothetical protein
MSGRCASWTRNLLHNAIKHCPPAAALAGPAGSATAASRCACATAARACRRCPRSACSSPSPPASGGSGGLGLAICLEIVRSAGGSIIWTTASTRARWPGRRAGPAGLGSPPRLPLGDRPADGSIALNDPRAAMRAPGQVAVGGAVLQDARAGRRGDRQGPGAGQRPDRQGRARDRAAPGTGCACARARLARARGAGTEPCAARPRWRRACTPRPPPASSRPRSAPPRRAGWRRSRPSDLSQGRPTKRDRRQLADWQRWSASADDLPGKAEKNPCVGRKPWPRKYPLLLRRPFRPHEPTSVSTSRPRNRVLRRRRRPGRPPLEPRSRP